MPQSSNQLTLILSPEVLEKIREIYRLAGSEEEFEKRPNELLGYLLDNILREARRMHAHGFVSHILDTSCTPFALERLREDPEERKRERERIRLELAEEFGEIIEPGWEGSSVPFRQ